MAKQAEPTKLRFTKRLLSELEPPDGSRQYLYDDKTAGLALCVTPSGCKTFYYCKKIGGRAVRFRLGRFPDISIEQARKLAAKTQADVADGKNPQARKRAARGEWTLGDLHGYYMVQHAKVHKKTWQEDENQFQRYLLPWRNRKLSDVSKQDVQKLHAKIGKANGHYAANRLRSLLCIMFNLAINLGQFDKQNPTTGVRKFREHSRKRFIQSDELPRFFEALDADSSPNMRDFFTLAILTGARRSNLLAMRWDELHLERQTWEIPETKNGDALTVHLPVEAVRLLQERQLQVNGLPWVFPARRGTTHGHMVEPRKGWERECKRAGLSDLRIHDLRRTLGSWQAATGASLPIIGKSLGHKNQATTAIYARLNIDPVRQSVDAATTAMMKAAKVGKKKMKKTK